MHSLNTFRSVGIAGLLVSCALAACANGGDEAILITKNVAPAAMCTFTGTSDEPFVPHGLLAPESSAYLLHPQFQSRLVADITDPGSAAQRTIIVTDANVDITFPANPELDSLDTSLVHFKELLSAPIPPNGTSDAEIAVIHKGLIDAVVAAQTSAAYEIEMEISVVVNGNYSGNAVTSQKFEYPVTLTTGLVQVPVPGDCPLPTGTAIAPGNSCNVFQDNPVTCCLQGAVLTCPATTM